MPALGETRWKWLLFPSLSAASPASRFRGAGALHNQQSHYRLIIPKATVSPVFLQGSRPHVSVLQGFSCWPLPGMKWPWLRVWDQGHGGGSCCWRKAELPAWRAFQARCWSWCWQSQGTESLLRQVKQLNARLLLKGFELCSSNPEVHPPPAMCLLISVSHQAAALLGKGLCNILEKL